MKTIVKIFITTFCIVVGVFFLITCDKANRDKNAKDNRDLGLITNAPNNTNINTPIEYTNRSTHIKLNGLGFTVSVVNEDLTGKNVLDLEIFAKEETEDFSPKEQIAWLSSYKNSDVEMQFNENGYSEDDLFTEMLPTSVMLIHQDEDNKYGPIVIQTSGNIYDIDEDYIYVITCGHQFQSDVNYENIIVYFCDKTFVEITPQDMVDLGCDAYMFKISKDDVSTETLSLLKSINISHSFDYPADELENLRLYCYKWDIQNKIYRTCYMENFDYVNYAILYANESNVLDGCSGGGLFDKYGNYWCQVTMDGKVSGVIYYRIEDALLELNPHYFD